ncbi:hypothetical protein Rhal01_00430 [Rubritalea halochordaticola]|uniref:DUF2071 domain-containing protein n=1 Tax=Rubritalea halochordaticola TaxID=714537 RepID=A0ABP9UX35_9BACT
MDCLNHTSHRPWPLVDSRPSWRQYWLDLAFFHWPVRKAQIQATLPDGLEVDTYDGDAWISVVPFRMEGVMMRGLPSIPGISNFPELNLRTYVKRDDKPGVWFYSLDADQSLAVWAARKFFHLPYFKANMSSVANADGSIRYRSCRECSGASFEGVYQPVGETYKAERGSLEEWLCERYCLYACSKSGKLYRGEVHHRQWPLQKVQYQIHKNGIGEAFGFDLSDAPYCAQFAKKLEVAVWGVELC